MNQQLKEEDRVNFYLYGQVIESRYVSAILANVDHDDPSQEYVFFYGTELSVRKEDVVRIGEQQTMVNDVWVTIHQGDSWGVLLQVRKPLTELVAGYNSDGLLRMAPVPEP